MSSRFQVQQTRVYPAANVRERHSGRPSVPGARYRYIRIRRAFIP